MTGVVQEVSGKRMLLVRFQHGCEKYLKLNQLTVVTLYKSPMEEEPKVPMVAMIPDDTVTLEKR